MKYFRVEVVAATPNPQQVIWAAMHQDYSEELVWNSCDRWPDEERSGELIIKHLLSGDRGHYGPLEHPQITVNVGYFPHSMMQQLRTHRVGVSFDVQSFRYTGQRIVDVVEGKLDIEEAFYLRPVGNYTNRQGKRYLYSEEQRQADLQWCEEACKHYKKRIDEGLSEEHARGIIPFDARQHFVLSCNVRSLMHLLDLRWKKDAQLEAQKFCELLWVHFEQWTPAIAQWYLENRAKKAKLAP
ncbi:FAD-dependent thymidylate synthase [Coleofasciculus sp. FACHB-64]|uniref:FAD-dependent thymidylate synthase n=1 Tax=Cyanophyceae TaxID=3028117 RepID=UPI0016894FA0|nr:FAD-dependent thymidylate synthase [Coleofasciculus sp. FACHB-501]MBD1896474.1 FAD-dependent thymidylate synthase [Coleofasciculus sp. FACHB-129]MBD2048541.1 FAD-dependent thymidylate synthase [Coleofasciculus sp. FACHB-64]